MDSWLVLALSLGYLAVLFAIAWQGDRVAARRGGTAARRAPLLYALSLAVYCTSWTFYGAIGRAATGGFDFLSIYVGPILMIGLGWPILAKMVRVAKAENVVSISDFISARYGKSRVLAALVTAIAVVVVLPYFALQLKAITISFEALAGNPFAGTVMPDLPGRTTLLVTVIMAAFAILFGVRTIHANEHHPGLMSAISAESLVKLAAALIVGAAITVVVAGGPVSLVGTALADPALAHMLEPRLGLSWWAMTLLSGFAILCLPRQFHVAVVENTHVGDIRTAAWLFPAYLIAINLFVVPVAMAGLLLFAGADMNADTFLVTVPLAMGEPGLALLAFIGGLSAATGMIVVGAVALSTMVCNDLIVPALMALRPGSRRLRDNPTRMLLLARRLAVIGILALAYINYLLLGSTFPLVTFGLVSFAGVAQFAPPLLLGLFFRQVTKAGAIAGLVAGFAAWVATVLLPSFAEAGVVAGSVLHDLLLRFGWITVDGITSVHDLDVLSGGALVSLALNLMVLLAVSRFTRQSDLEARQAERFVSMRHELGERRVHPRGATLADLHELAARYVGRTRADAAFADLAQARNPHTDGFDAAPPLRIDQEAVQATEWLLAGAIGSASARVVVASLLADRRLSRSDARSIIDEASRAILDQHTLLRSTIENVGKGICAFDRDFRILVWNRRFLDMLDVPESLITVGTPLSDIVDHLHARGEFSHDREIVTLLRRSDPDLRGRPDMYQRIRPDGTVLEVTSNPLPDGGFVAVFNDVTERHRAAEALREANEGLERGIAERTADLADAKAEADRANRAKTRLLAAVSHDLLQPLHAARLFISAARDRGNDPLVGQADAALRSVEQLLGDLLDITRLDTGVVKPSRGAVVVDEVLRPLMGEMAVVAARHGLKLVHVPCSVTVETDAVLLRRILQNLIGNALRYTRSGRVLVGCRRLGDRLRIEVHDTGPGIPPEKQAEIFQEFRQLDGGPGDRDKGLGLGLSIVERLAAILGHRVGLRSTPGRGSCFSVELPVSESRALARRVAPETRGGGFDGTLVLCIENEPAIAEAMTALLGGWSCEVVWGTTAEAALSALGDRRPDIVLTDYHLDHGLSGLDVLAGLRTRFGATLPAAVITADRSDTVRRAAEAADCRIAYKPLRPGALRALIAHMVAKGRSRAADPDAAAE